MTRHRARDVTDLLTYLSPSSGHPRWWSSNWFLRNHNCTVICDYHLVIRDDSCRFNHAAYLTYSPREVLEPRYLIETGTQLQFVKFQSISKSLCIQYSLSSFASSAQSMSPDIHSSWGASCWFSASFVTYLDFHIVWGMSCWFTMLFIILNMHFVPCSLISSHSTIKNFRETTHFKCHGNPNPLRPV